MVKNNKFWFKKKIFGWGWTPTSWEGWGIIVLFVIFQIWNFMRLDAVSHSNSDTIRPFVIQTFLAVLVLCFIASKKSEN